MDNFIDGSMAMVVSTTRLTDKAMNTKSSHLFTTTMTQLWDTNSSAKTKTNRDPQGVIIQSQT